MSVREGWNFHNDIALPIEHKMRRYFGEQYDHYADSIEGGEFINSLEKILFFKQATTQNLSRSDIDSFIDKYEEYKGAPGNSIPAEIAQSILDEFKDLERE